MVHVPCFRHLGLGLIGLGLVAVLGSLGCASGGTTDEGAAAILERLGGEGAGGASSAGAEERRPLPHPIMPPPEFLRAVSAGTRTDSGVPGPFYWQQHADYRLRARLSPGQKRLTGQAEITYYNNSPDALDTLYLHLSQNVHAEGAVRSRPAEVTGGVQLRRIALNGQELEADPAEGEAGYVVEGTIIGVHPSAPIGAGATAELEIEWSFRVPARGAGNRMGWDGEDFFFLAYWYPQFAVYDDVVGWQKDPFRGAAEFYTGFGSYEVVVEAPHGWLVRGTGTLQNRNEVLPDAVSDRLAVAEQSDTVINVLTPTDFGVGQATRRSPNGRLAWRFVADTVPDFAFSVTRRSRWDVTRTPVGDRDRDGAVDFSRIEALYRVTAPKWASAARYARHAIEVQSRYSGLPYPWPHMTAVEGGGIIEGGMEFPMMTLIGNYNARGDSALYYVTAHELAHMWVPMIVSNDERRHAWMDEGMTTFLENQSRREFFPGSQPDSLDQEAYVEWARSGREGEMMRWTDFHYPEASGVASYSKPASLLVALRGLLGEERFKHAYRTFLAEWAFKHPKPWDFFATFDRIADRDLGWFWHSWYFETWTLDQAIEEVVAIPDGTRIVVGDRGLVPMPLRLRITRVDGTEIHREIPVETWLAGSRRAVVTVESGAPVIRVEIDPDHAFPDIDRTNNVWVR